MPDYPGQSRLAHTLRAPVRLWRSSLPMRVIATTLAASAIVITLGGIFLLALATEGVLAGKRHAAVSEAAAAIDTAQRQLWAADITTTSVNDLLTQLTFEVANRGAVSGQYQVIVQGPVSDIRSGGVLPASVPDALREQVMANDETGRLWVTPTEVLHADDTSEPGLAIGATLETPTLARYPIYLIFPLTQEQRTLEVLERAALSTGFLLVLLLAIIAALVSRQVVAPIREARLQAERITSGHLDDRMTVRGTDDLASLAESMNNMAVELQKQITQLEELSAVQHRFVSDVSHELRTPLTTVRMAAEMLHDARTEFEPMEQRAVELLQHELDRFEALLGDLLEISRFDAGAAELTRENVDLLVVVTSEVEAQQSFADRTGSALRITSTGPTTAAVDVRRVRRILRNLITNAIEHGEGKPIDIQLAGDDKAVAIAVRDHGVGFEANHVKQVFHRFWRADPARNRTVGGTGLGLSIAMEDTRLHGGWINAWGRPQQGAQFRLTLPRTAGAVLEISPLPVIPRDLVESAPTRPTSTTGTDQEA